jgi:hypothetical protein
VDAKAAVAVAEQHSGKCLCGAVTYRAAGLADIWYCHCRQCRRLTGHYLPACRTTHEQLSVSGEVVWAPHSGQSEHGRCAACGSLLFWATKGTKYISVLPGSLEHTRGIGVNGHIFVAEKGDYYEISDGLPQFAGLPEQGLQSQ